MVCEGAVFVVFSAFFIIYGVVPIFGGDGLGLVGADEPVPFVCECGDGECIEGVELTVDEYTSAHSAPNRFTVKPEHVFPALEG